MAEQPRPRGLIRNPRDFVGGFVLAALALVALWASRGLPGQQGFALGPGTGPRLFAILLGINGLGIALHGLLVDGPKLERYAVRGPLFVTAAILVFAALIRPAGLVAASFLTILVGAAATPEVRWRETIPWAVVLTAFCAFLFPYVLNLPMPLWPRF